MDDNEIVDDHHPSEPKDKNAIAIQLMKRCATFLSYNGVRLENHFDDLNSLYSMWTEATAEGDYSFDYRCFFVFFFLFIL